MGCGGRGEGFLGLDAPHEAQQAARIDAGVHKHVEGSGVGLVFLIPRELKGQEFLGVFDHGADLGAALAKGQTDEEEGAGGGHHRLEAVSIADVGQFVGDDAGEFFAIGDLFDQAAADENLAAGEGDGIDLRVVDEGDGTMGAGLAHGIGKAIGDGREALAKDPVVQHGEMASDPVGEAGAEIEFGGVGDPGRDETHNVGCQQRECAEGGREHDQEGDAGSQGPAGTCGGFEALDLAVEVRQAAEAGMVEKGGFAGQDHPVVVLGIRKQQPPVAEAVELQATQGDGEGGFRGPGDESGRGDAEFGRPFRIALAGPSNRCRPTCRQGMHGVLAPGQDGRLPAPRQRPIP